MQKYEGFNPSIATPFSSETDIIFYNYLDDEGICSD